MFSTKNILIHILVDKELKSLVGLSAQLKKRLISLSHIHTGEDNPTESKTRDNDHFITSLSLFPHSYFICALKHYSPKIFQYLSK